MYINELFLTENNGTDVIQQLPDGYATEKDDQSTLLLSSLRKSRLTLGQLNQLRMMNDIRKLEHETKIKSVASMYKPPAQEGGM